MTRRVARRAWRQVRTFVRCTQPTTTKHGCRNPARWERIVNGRTQRACQVHRRMIDQREGRWR